MESTRNCESNSQGEIANIDECNGIVMNCCIENACYEM